MRNHDHALPKQIPNHPTQGDENANDLTLGQLMDGDGIDMSTVMTWAECVNEYAYALAPPPELPSEFDQLSLSQVTELPVSSCSSEDIVRLVGWYWYHSGENESIFHKEHPEASQDAIQTVEEIKQDYNLVHRFDTELDRINVDALAMSVYSEDGGGVDWDGFTHVERTNGDAAVFHPPVVSEAVVLVFDNGRGYYCCQSEADIKPVDEWFRAALTEWTTEGIVPLQVDDIP